MSNVILPPGQIVIPIVGTTHWDANGEALGVWGANLMVSPMLLKSDGSIRDLNALERALLERTHGVSA